MIVCNARDQRSQHALDLGKRGAKGTRTPGLLHAMPDESVWSGPTWFVLPRSVPRYRTAPTNAEWHRLGS